MCVVDLEFLPDSTPAAPPAIFFLDPPANTSKLRSILESHSTLRFIGLPVLLSIVMSFSSPELGLNNADVNGQASLLETVAGGGSGDGGETGPEDGDGPGAT